MMERSEIERRKATLDECSHEEGGVEFWCAREIQEALGYTK